MKTLNLHTQYGKGFDYIIDDLLLIGIYRTTTIEYLTLNDVILGDSNVKFHLLNSAVIIRAFSKDNSRIDFLITEDVCFEGLELISLEGFKGQFYDDFVTAFEMLGINKYEDEVWYD